MKENNTAVQPKSMGKKKTIIKITVFLLICLIGSLLVFVPIMKFFVDRSNSDLRWAQGFGTMVYSAFFLLALFAEGRIEKLNLWKLPKVALQSKTILVAVVIGILWQLSALLLSKLSIGVLPPPTYDIPRLLFLVLATGLLGPFAEEMLFRKYLVDMMERGGFKPLVIIAVSSLLFFSMHLGDNFLRIDTLIFAIPICWLYVRYHDIRYCVIAHCVCNSAGIFIPFAF